MDNRLLGNSKIYFSEIFSDANLTIFICEETMISFFLKIKLLHIQVEKNGFSKAPFGDRYIPI